MFANVWWSRLTSLAAAAAMSLAGAACAPSAPAPAPAAPAPDASGGGGGQVPKGPLPMQPLTPNLSPSMGGAPAAPARPAPSAPAGMTVKSLSLSGDPVRVIYPGPSLSPGTRYPVLIFHHGHGMDEDQLLGRTGLAAAAAAEGWLSASAAFGGRTHWGNPDALRRTGTLIAELVANHQADPERIYLVGFSMGGGTALLAAANPLNLPYRVAAVASSQGFSDLAAMMKPEAGGGAYASSIAQAYGGTLEPAEAEAHSPLTRAEALAGVPVYLEHGDADTAVPVDHTWRLSTRLQALGLAPEVHVDKGAGHSEASIREDRIIAFLRGKRAN